MAQIDPRKQSVDEWLADYDGYDISRIDVYQSKGADQPPAIAVPTQKHAEDTIFRYVDHRTTKTRSLVMEFESLNGQINAIKYFNIKLNSGKRPYPAGARGQFNPPPRGAFREFWMQTVGVAPSRWSRVHKSMRSHLRDIVFVGEIKKALDGKGQHYDKFTKISSKLGTI